MHVEHVCNLLVCCWIRQIRIPFRMFRNADLLCPIHVRHTRVPRAKLHTGLLLFQAGPRTPMHAAGIVEVRLEVAEGGLDREPDEILWIPCEAMQHRIHHFVVAYCLRSGILTPVCNDCDVKGN